MVIWPTCIFLPVHHKWIKCASFLNVPIYLFGKKDELIKNDNHGALEHLPTNFHMITKAGVCPQNTFSIHLSYQLGFLHALKTF